MGGSLIENPLDASAIAQQIVDLRKTSEISPEQLTAMIHFTKEQQKRVLEFLGTRTWVWRIQVEKADEVRVQRIFTN